MKTSDWREYFSDRGLDDDLIETYINYASPLLKKNLPVIFEFDHLSAILGINRQYLANMVASPESFYREFHIPKRSGEKRLIRAPHQSLLFCQRWILSNILYKIKIHRSAHGFVPGASIKSNAEPHIGSAMLLKMDLRDFFPSIPKSWVFNLFSDLGYAGNVSYYLASLCCFGDSLAQGAATSPAISNIVLKSLDNRLRRLTEKVNLKYTRYADDLTFSGNFIHCSFPSIVKNIVSEYGLSINDHKTRLKSHHGTRIVTGVSICNNTLSAPRQFKRKIKNEIHFIEKFGILSHMSHNRIFNPNYLQSLLGRISFWLYLEPENNEAIRAKSYISKLTNFGEPEQQAIKLA
ncbi:TPA: retron St85 family RNA-directed DNA polymerase [Burkholderia cenocepacia]|nr:retron St85 family RNA-directed DNA polymerase [Burkholderia cenocepacia]HDR9811133.1 retron St85 family RNA-directed DNA polymerase [Burkholderia cenocepacia]HDR9819790.1 retron St85 family RNA-directed DNA polymerase [Burkholderia cenocepacia]HDR9828161.1 retron St85 family RNA-directed DNA polymerase [Burkholderia cenocepacia]